MVYEESDDMIGIGDWASFISKARNVGKKVRGVVRKVRGRIQAVRGKAKRAGVVVRDEVEQTRAAVAPARSRSGLPVAPGRGPGAGAGAVEWVKANPMIVAGAALAGVLLFARKR